MLQGKANVLRRHITEVASKASSSPSSTSNTKNDLASLTNLVASLQEFVHLDRHAFRSKINKRTNLGVSVPADYSNSFDGSLSRCLGLYLSSLTGISPEYPVSPSAASSFLVTLPTTFANPVGIGNSCAHGLLHAMLGGFL
jgi:hypothetical protein